MNQEAQDEQSYRILDIRGVRQSMEVRKDTEIINDKMNPSYEVDPVITCK